MEIKQKLTPEGVQENQETLIPQLVPTSIGPFGSDSTYHRTLQGKPIHGLASATSSRGMQIDAISRTGTINSDGVIITVDEEALSSVSAQTFKVLIMLLTKVTEQLPRENQISPETIQRGRLVRITLEEYMRACKIKDTKTAREQLNAAIAALYGISLEWDETGWSRPENKSRRVKQTTHHRMRIVEYTVTSEKGKAIKRGAAEVRLTYSMAEYLSGAYIMPYPSALLAINTNNHPYSIPLGWKLCALYNINYSNEERRGRTTVATLLQAAKGIPRYDAIATTGQIYDRIVRPFDRDLQALVEGGVLSSYHYETIEGEIIEGGKIGSLSYAAFRSLNVVYTFATYPDQTPRIEAKQKRIKAAISAAARRGKAQREEQQKEEEE